MLARYLGLLILAILFVSCNKADDNKRDEVKELDLEKLEEITLEVQEPIFGRFLEIFRVSKDGKYFLFNDLSQQKAYVFTSNGGFVNRIGESGKGPKGIVGLYGFDFTEENEVFIYDSSQRMVKIFDIDGSLINVASINEDSDFSIPPFHIRYHNGTIYTPIIEPIYIDEPQNSKLIASISIDGTVDTLFG
ncbi:MAG: 6-bladed beta-propeller [Candidatus Paceibacterota bacterium]